MRTSNYFDPIAVDDDTVDTETNQDDKTENESPKKTEPKPPPLFIHGVLNYQQMINNILTVLKPEEYVCRSLANNVVKINAKEVVAYRELVRHLRKENVIFHSYQVKQDRAYRVVLRHLHHSIPTDDIKEEIEAKGFKVRNITNVLHRATKEPLSLFYVDLEPAKNNKEIYDIEFLLNMKIIVEPPRKNANIVQCKRCQMYGHTKAYCTRPYACVKCGGEHNSSSCTKKRDTPATCALCEGSHPANYRGCSVYKDLQSMRRNPLQQPIQTIPNTSNISESTQLCNEPTSTQFVSQNLRYSDIVRNGNQDQNFHPTPIQQESSINHQQDIPLTTFLHEFKSMFNQLMNQNTAIINMLQTVISKLVAK